MEFSFIFTIIFMLLGPIKLIPLFAKVTIGADVQFRRSTAIWSAAIASAVCAIVAVAGGTLLGKYHVSLAALRLTAGLVLLISALQAIFKKAQSSSPAPVVPTALQLAASPVAVPGIVPPAGIAAILIGMMLAPEYPGLTQDVAICLAIVMALDFLVMWFIAQVMKTPGLSIVLTVLGAVLVFVQACLAIQIMLTALEGMGIIHV
jgi:multiple antibiotic resistance protein